MYDFTHLNRKYNMESLSQQANVYYRFKEFPLCYGFTVWYLVLYNQYVWDKSLKGLFVRVDRFIYRPVKIFMIKVNSLYKMSENLLISQPFC